MRSRSGLTLIELLIVIVIIGILAAIAIPKFANTKEKATLASMTSDLRKLAAAQKRFFADNNDYAGSADPTIQTNGVGGAGKVIFSPTAGNLVTLNYRSRRSWAATMTNRSLKGSIKGCAIYTGSAPPLGTPPGGGAQEGTPYCY